MFTVVTSYIFSDYLQSFNLDSATSVVSPAYFGETMVYAALTRKGAESFWPKFCIFLNIFPSLLDIHIMIL
jgi:hypothetical protein